MSASATQIFSFLDEHRTCSIEKHEVHSVVFGGLRRSIRLIVARLIEAGDDDSQEHADRLRILLSEWLTVPVRFESSVVESIAAMGDGEAVERRWGREVREAYEQARAAGRAIQDVENPVRTVLRETIQHLRGLGRRWRIYCHRRARRHFESILEGELDSTELFLHSVTDYRDVEPFDVLIKVGPLRSKGWGSAPDVVLTAPRFSTLVHIVWSGCADENDFGYDPAITVGAGATPASGRTADADGLPHAVAWQTSTTHCGDPLDDTAALSPDLDELRFFREIARASEVRRATLVQIDEEDGILYPPHSQILTFDPMPGVEGPIGYRLPGETLAEGVFLVWPLLGTPDLGALRAGEGRYSRVWKERLRAEVVRAPDELLHRLRAAGVDLLHLRSCVRQWCRPPSTVIHAPQQRRHFEGLIRVLGIDHHSVGTSAERRRPWWEYAWAEIGHTRGEAIQTGIQEHEIVDEELLEILTDLLPEIRRHAEAEGIFLVEIPPGRSLSGAVRFYRVRSIEEGFLAPSANLKQICDLDTAEQWRV